MSDGSPHEARLQAHLGAIRYAIAALVFATLTYSFLVVRRKNVVLRTE